MNEGINKLLTSFMCPCLFRFHVHTTEPMTDANVWVQRWMMEGWIISGLQKHILEEV